METWAGMIGEPVIEGKKATVFGDGTNPVSFVAVEDVARLVVAAAESDALRDRTVDVGGPEAYTLPEVAELFGSETNQPAQISKVPVPMMRVMSGVLGPFNPPLSRLMGMGAWMASSPQTCDTASDVCELIGERTPLEDVVQSIVDRSEAASVSQVTTA